MEGYPRSRTEAKLLGVKSWFSGKPCKQGHIALWTVKGCTECWQNWKIACEARKARELLINPPKLKQIPKDKDLTGKRFGLLTVVSRGENNSRGEPCWNCVCDCGGEKLANGYSLKQERVKSCGCLQKSHLIDITGQRFGRLLVLSFNPKKVNRESYWNCVCDCGNERVIKGYSLRSGDTKSCGCLCREMVSELFKGKPNLHSTTHGMTGTRTNNIWDGMIKVCLKKGNKKFKGTAVCPSWRDFSSFLADMGAAPEGMNLLRIDKNKGFSPENCHWSKLSKNPDQKGLRSATRRRQAEKAGKTYLPLEERRAFTLHKEEGRKALALHNAPHEALRQQFRISAASLLKWGTEDQDQIKELKKQREAERWRVKYSTDPLFRIKENLRTQIQKQREVFSKVGDLIRQSLVNGGRNSGVYTILGYKPRELFEHIERLFTPDMSWGAYCEGKIHLDHKIRKSSFDMSNHLEFKAAWQLPNLQPLWAEDNLTKRDRLPEHWLGGCCELHYTAFALAGESFPEIPSWAWGRGD